MTLSDKIIDTKVAGGLIPTEDAKEFIRLLKKEFITDHVNSRFYLNLIDKLAGEKLI